MYSWDPHSPTTISVCDAKTHYNTDNHLDKSSANISRSLLVENEAMRTVSEFSDDVCDTKEEKTNDALVQMASEIEQLRVLSAEKDELASQVHCLTVEKEISDREKEVSKQCIEGNRRLHLLSMSIHSEDNSQLMDELQQSCCLQQTRLDDFHIKHCINETAANSKSIIYHVERRNVSGVNYAMKAMLNPCDASDEDVAMEDAEIEALFKAKYDVQCGPHPNIVRILHHFCAALPSTGLPNWHQYGGQRSLFLLMKEYDCSLESHCKKLRESGSVDEHFLLLILLQLFKAIEHLAKHNILHRNLKLDNVLLKLEPNCTRAAISDFGCSYKSDESLASADIRVLCSTAGGNPAHHSPELSTLSLDSSNACDVSKADVWAAGIMAYEMATGLDATDILLYTQKQRQYTTEILPALGGTYSVSCKCFLQQLVSHSVDNRPNASQAIQLCSIILYGPTIPTDGDIKVEDVQCWLVQQLTDLRTRHDDELLKDPFYVKYLAAISPQVVTDLINTFLVK